MTPPLSFTSHPVSHYCQSALAGLAGAIQKLTKMLPNSRDHSSKVPFFGGLRKQNLLGLFFESFFEYPAQLVL
jgi:hypothetical protein